MSKIGCRNKAMLYSWDLMASLCLFHLLFCLVFWTAVPVVKNLQGDDAVASGWYHVSKGHQRVPSFLEEHSLAWNNVLMWKVWTNGWNELLSNIFSVTEIWKVTVTSIQDSIMLHALLSVAEYILWLNCAHCIFMHIQSIYLERGEDAGKRSSKQQEDRDCRELAGVTVVEVSGCLDQLKQPSSAFTCAGWI